MVPLAVYNAVLMSQVSLPPAFPVDPPKSPLGTILALVYPAVVSVPLTRMVPAVAGVSAVAIADSMADQPAISSVPVVGVAKPPKLGVPRTTFVLSQKTKACRPAAIVTPVPLAVLTVKLKPPVVP